VTDVFISYRTADEPVTAVFIKHVLGEEFGAECVFLDNTSIPLGADFPPVLEEALASCRALVAVIGSRWFSLDDRGRRRVDNPQDWVRREILGALGRGIPVIPVLVGDVRLAADQLPTELARLADRQFLPVRVRSVEHDLQPLVERLVPLVAPDRRDAPAAGGTPAVSNEFHGRVDASDAVFGIQNVYRH
jgi:hypothetical protein